MSRTAAGITIAVLAIVVLVADQFAKTLAIEGLPSQRVVPVLGDALQLYLVRNPGAAFSLGENVTWLFTLALAAVAGTICWLAVTRIRSRLWAIALGLLLGGVCGNLFDRLFREPGFPVGAVVDYISTPWMMPAIYNLADVFIVSMMIAIALLVLFGIGFSGVRDRRKPSDGDDAESAGDAPGDAGSPLADDGAPSSGMSTDSGKVSGDEDSTTRSAPQDDEDSRADTATASRSRLTAPAATGNRRGGRDRRLRPREAGE